jgi:ATP-dependent RNA helicase DeaD
MDHMRRGTLKLDALKMVILDEVDVMLNMGFRDDIELILQATPKERQTVFFSATIPRPIQQLIEKYSRNPQQVRIEQKAMTVPTVEQVYYEVDRRYKVELLTRLIDIHDHKLGIIFCNTKRMVDELVDSLNAQGYSADRLHGDMSQMMRDRVMQKFRKSGLEFLVATDVAARGIDVDDVQVVFNYDLPYDVEDYLHRIGRTGRAGRSGLAVSFVAGREMFQIYNIERFTKMKIQRGKPPSANEVEEARANVFLDKIRLTLRSSDFKRQDHLIERLLEEGFSSTDIASALLHHLQYGEGAAPAKAPAREEREERPRPERAPREERLQRPVVARLPVDPDRPKKVVTPPKGPRMKTVNVPVSELVPQVEAAPVEKVAPVKAPEVAAPVAKVVEAKAPEVKPAAQATYTDEEILASVPPEPKKVITPKPKHVEKPSRRTPDNQTRLFMNVGEEMEVKPIDVVNLIAGETGLPGKVVGRVDIRERHLFVDVASEHVKGIIAKLNRSTLKDHALKVKVA